jgi:ribosomal protein S18 acetylase RimI-like enzyme
MTAPKVIQKGKLIGVEISGPKKISRLKGMISGFWQRRLIHSEYSGLKQTFHFSKVRRAPLEGKIVIENSVGNQIGEVHFSESGTTIKKFLHVSGLGVNHNHLHEGLAVQMLSELVAFARKRKKISALLLDVRKDNSQAVKIYSKMGFVEQKTYFEVINNERIECVKMRLDLGK